jgi:hypothetical protein
MNPRSREKKKQSITPEGNNPETRNKMEGWDKTYKGAENKKDLTKDQEIREQATNEPTDRPSNKKEQGSCATPMDGEIRDDKTPM